MRTINITKPEPKVFVEYQGSKIALVDLAKIVGIEARTLRMRYRSGERGERLWRPLDFEKHNFAKMRKQKPVSEREQKRRDAIAAAKAAHAAAFAKPLIDAKLISASERKSIRAGIRYARQVWLDEVEEPA